MNRPLYRGKFPNDQKKNDPPGGMDTQLFERLSLAKNKRLQAEESRQQVAKEIEQLTRELNNYLIQEGERALEEANHAKIEAPLTHIEAQTELEHARVSRAEADAYHEKTIGEIRRYAQQARAIKAEAVAYREQLLSEVRQQAEKELRQTIVEADSYCERVLAEAQRQAEAIISEAASKAKREGDRIKQRSLLESKKMLAEIELIKITAQDELEAKALDAESEWLRIESQNILLQAESKLVEQNPGVELNLTHSSAQAGSAEGHLAEVESKRGLDHAEAQLEKLSPDHELAPGNVQAAGSDWPLPDDELILGFEIAGFSKAYPVRMLSNRGAINDSIGEHDVLLSYDEELKSGAVFQRVVQDRCLTFNLSSRSDDDVMLLKDHETESIWEALTGLAISGPLRGARLKSLDYECTLWFAWIDQHASTEVYVD